MRMRVQLQLPGSNPEVHREEPSYLSLQAEVLRLQRALDVAEGRQASLLLPDVPAPPPPTAAALSRTTRYVRLTAVELASLELVYVALCGGASFARVLPAEHDPLPTDEREVDAFIAARTEEWRSRLALKLEPIFRRHDQRERATWALTGHAPVTDDDDEA